MKPLLLLMLAFAPIDSGADALVEEYYRLATMGNGADRATIAPLLARAEQSRDARPEDPGVWLEVGVIRAAYAQEVGVKGLAQLQRARRELEHSIALDRDWRDGYAAAFLARLYMTVPPWPIAFGSGKRAASLLQEVLHRHPESLAGNLYEGLRLLAQGDRKEAVPRLEAAVTAKLGCDCPIWSRSLRDQAGEGLAAVD